MKNYSTKSTNKLLVKFVIKSVISTVLSLFCLTFLASEIIFKADIDLSKLSIVSLFVVGFSSIIISFISVYGIKNSGLLFGIMSEIPLIFYMLVNAIFHSSNWIYFLLKILIVILLGAFGGIIASEKSKKIKVK